jgi:hypothetical protein
MQRCEFDESFENKELLKAILMSKMDQIEVAIMEGDYQDAIEILYDAYHLCVGAGEMSLATAFFEQARTIKARIGIRDDGNDAFKMSNDGMEKAPDEPNKCVAMKALLKTMLLLSMRKNMAHIQNIKQLHGE